MNFVRLILQSVTFSLFVGFAANADILKLKSDAPINYQVKRGDTLWDISGLYLEKPWHWPKLWNMNPQIANPHLIYPGDRLLLSYDQQGNPMLSLNSKPLRRLTPNIRYRTQQKQIAIPREAVQILIENALFVTDETQQGIGFVVANDAGAKIMADSSQVTIQGSFSNGEYLVARFRENLLDDEGKVLGTLYDRLAIAEISSQFPEQKLSKARLRAVRAPVRQGDILLDKGYLPNFEQLTFRREIASEGTIIAASNRQKYHGKWEIVVLDKGAQHGLQVGQVFDVVQDGPTVSVEEENATYVERELFSSADATPEFVKGELVVFQPRQQLSLGLITKAVEPIALKDRFRSP